MGRTVVRLPGFCLNRVATRARVRSPAMEAKPAVSAPVETCSPLQPPIDSAEKGSEDGEKQLAAPGRKWRSRARRRGARCIGCSLIRFRAMTLLLFCKWRSLLDRVRYRSHSGYKADQMGRDPKDYDLLNAMKNICQAKRPEVHVELSLVEGKEQGPTIVDEARKQGASLLVLGQRKRSITWRLLMMWAGNRTGGGVVDYCVQNSTCMTLAVRRKSRRAGGYLITTRRHRDFWLLA